MRSLTPEERLLRNDTAHAKQYEKFDAETETFGAPVAPLGLNARALSIFNEFVAMVTRKYSLCETDTAIITLFAKNRDQLLFYEEFLMKEGSTYMRGEGIVARPEFGMLKDCKNLELKILSEFGLTPGSEGKVRRKKVDTGKVNPFAALSKNE